MSGYGSGKRKRLTSEQRNEAILAAAADVFADMGYDRASMREIARQAGVTTPVLYDHFHSKTELYAATVNAQANELIQRWMSPVKPKNADELFDLATGAFFRSVSDSKLIWNILFAGRPHDPEALQIYLQAQMYAAEAIAAVIRQLQPADLPVSFDPERAIYALAEAVKAAGHALIGWWYENSDVPVEEVIQLNRIVVWKGLSSIIGTE